MTSQELFVIVKAKLAKLNEARDRVRDLNEEFLRLDAMYLSLKNQENSSSK